MFDFNSAELHIQDNSEFVFNSLKLASTIILHKKFQFSKEEIDFDLTELLKEKVIKVEGEKILLNQNDLFNYILDYSYPKEVYLYLISIIVDIYDSNRKIYAKNIIQSIPKELERLKNIGIDIKEIGAIAISEEGEKILPRIGFKQDKQILTIYNHKYPVFRTTVDNILETIY